MDSGGFSVAGFLFKALAPIAIFGSLAWFLKNKFTGTNGVGFFSNLFSFFKQRKEEEQKDAAVIKSLDQQQTTVVANINSQETLSVEQQKKIRDTVDKASEIIQKTLSETDKTTIANSVNADWDKL